MLGENHFLILNVVTMEYWHDDGWGGIVGAVVFDKKTWEYMKPVIWKPGVVTVPFVMAYDFWNGDKKC